MTGIDLRLTLGRNIKFFRRLRSLSQMELAEKADISIAFLSNIERGNKWPYPDTLVNLAKALEVEVCELFQDGKAASAEPEKKLLTKFLDDLSRSLNKSLALAAKQSLESVGKLYAEGKDGLQ
jgi:transcriptional regulator with XRE-family HTH domain